VVNEPDRTRFDEDTEPAGALRLRSEAPPVMRLSRRVLTGLVGIGDIVIFGALIFAVRRRVGTLQHGQQDDARRPHQPAAGLWRSHAGQAAAGDPWPAFARRAGRPQRVPGLNAMDPEQQRLAQENEAACLSRLFATTGTRERPAAAAPAAPAADTKTAP
jgi:type IV secretion system protein TrbI